MSKRLVTIASFDLAAQARLAHNVLTEAGIKSTISDETLVAMDWLLSNAVGGVKVQVWEEDAERAVTVLEEKLGENGEGLKDTVSPEELAAQAEAAIPDEGEEPEPEATSEPATPKTLTAPERVNPPVARGSREDYAKRLVFAGMLGLVFPPIAGYALYLFLNAAFDEGELSSQGRFNVWIGGLMTLGGLGWFVLFLSTWALF